MIGEITKGGRTLSCTLALKSDTILIVARHIDLDSEAHLNSFDQCGIPIVLLQPLHAQLVPFFHLIEPQMLKFIGNIRIIIYSKVRLARPTPTCRTPEIPTKICIR